MSEAKLYEVATLGNVVTDVIVNVERLPVDADVHQSLVELLRISLGGYANALIAAARLGANTSSVGLVPLMTQPLVSQR